MQLFGFLFVVVLTISILLGGASRARASSNHRANQSVVKTPQHAKIAKKIREDTFISLTELKTRLKELKRAKKPDPVSNTGAMCYMMSSPTGTATICCHRCSQTTLLARGFFIKELEACQRLASELRRFRPALDIKIDNHQFCCHCNPSITTNKAKKLKIYADIRFSGTTDKIHKVEVNEQKLIALRALISGSRRTRDGRNYVEDLKRKHKELCELLNIHGK